MLYPTKYILKYVIVYNIWYIMIVYDGFKDVLMCFTNSVELYFNLPILVISK